MDQVFEWDDAKAEQNYAKHGVDFIDAAQIFLRERLEAPDERSAYGEVRYRAIGEHEGMVYVVIYTWRDSSIRIISAWKAGRHDRKRYHDAIAG